jgi:hypothetical protein
MLSRTSFPFVLTVAVLLAACSEKSAPPSAVPAAPAATAGSAQATKSVEMYRQLLESKSYELAAPIGQEIVTKYPDTPAAKEVQETLADTTAKATAITSRRRLERLWSYQTGKESGGDQSTASIYDSKTSNPDHVRLVLRRHSAWGQSVYLFSDGKGFECGKGCTISMRFDDEDPQRMKAHLPETGEPAIFISDDRAFLAKMSKAQKISMDVVLRNKGNQTLVFEVGGYDPEKFAAVVKKK